MKLKILYFIYRFIQLFIVIFIADRLDINFWARFGILLVLFLIFDETEAYVQRFFNVKPDLTEEDISNDNNS